MQIYKYGCLFQQNMMKLIQYQKLWIYAFELSRAVRLGAEGADLGAFQKSLNRKEIKK
jgi:hypothetical protein